ncbi:hypothetical protein Hypma_005554 [Hypsizygus marmoreus]|uniref:Uncharacterized protein n=1 Tax=Hypsizygus marmoreus TaxID=39966 RepID=A0A369K473_HYPMA|nr:hypothetical protein Hypma_005554 [Hypsizygus marmoreus]
MWHDPQELRAAGERQYKIALENVSRESKTEEEIQVLLGELAARCEAEPKNFDDRVRICFAALACSQVLMDCVVCHPSRPFNDRVVVFRLIANINRKANNLAPLSSDPPRLVKLIPDAPITRPVTVRDVKRWRAYPKELLRRAFVYHKDEIRRVFLVADYCVKEIGGHCYELRFEDCGPDVFTFGLEEVLGMVAEAEFVTNTQMNA